MNMLQLFLEDRLVKDSPCQILFLEIWIILTILCLKNSCDLLMKSNQIGFCLRMLKDLFILKKERYSIWWNNDLEIWDTKFTPKFFGPLIMEYPSIEIILL